MRKFYSMHQRLLIVSEHENISYFLIKRVMLTIPPLQVAETQAAWLWPRETPITVRDSCPAPPRTLPTGHDVKTLTWNMDNKPGTCIKCWPVKSNPRLKLKHKWKATRLQQFKSFNSESPRFEVRGESGSTLDRMTLAHTSLGIF